MDYRYREDREIRALIKSVPPYESRKSIKDRFGVDRYVKKFASNLGEAAPAPPPVPAPLPVAAPPLPVAAPPLPVAAPPLLPPLAPKMEVPKASASELDPASHDVIDKYYNPSHRPSRISFTELGTAEKTTKTNIVSFGLLLLVLFWLLKS